MSQHAINPQRIALLYGGTSAERAVSLGSGEAVARALESKGRLVDRIDPAVLPVTQVDWSQYDCAFLALHGTYGEDGQVQRELDKLGVRYTGSDAVASALAFDKVAAKARFDECDIPTPRAVSISETDDAAAITEKARRLGFPLVVKPRSQGSSVGITIVNRETQLASALARCFHYDSHGLIETAVLGDEWTVGVVNGATLNPVRIAATRTFYDYEAKYTDTSTQYHPADAAINPALVGRLRALGLAAFHAIGAADVARVDIRLDEHGHAWVLEVNTLPGFTSHSLLPKAAASEGIAFADLCEMVLDTAARAQHRRAG